MSAPESGSSYGETRNTARERPAPKAKPFYDFLLGRDLRNDEIFSNHYIISGDVRLASDRIEEYISQNAGTPVKILTVMYGERVASDYLIACDPVDELLIVVQTEDD